MVSKKIILVLFSVFMLLALVSAGDLSLANTTSKDVSTTPNKNVEFKFVLSNANPTDSYAITWSSDADGAGSWTTVPTLSTIASGSSSSVLTAVLNIPSGASPGMYNPTITVQNTTSQSATITFNVNVTPVSSILLTKTREVSRTQSGLMTVRNTGNTATTVALSVSPTSALLSSETLNLAAGESSTVSVNVSAVSGLKFGNNAVTVTAVSNGASSSLSFNLQQTFCKFGEVGTGNLTIRNIDISSSGDDDNEWMPLDEITVEVDVKNLGDDDVDDVLVEMALFDSSGNDASGDLDFLNSDEEQVDIGNINDGDTETATFEFKVPADFDTGNYKLAIKAYSDGAEDSICADSSGDLSDSIYESVSLEQESDEGKFIVFDNIVVPDEVTCGDSVVLTADAYNVGEDDQDRVKVNLKNSELDLSESYEILSDLNIGDRERITFTFDVPNNAKDKTYNLGLSADYDYKNGNYRESSDEESDVSLKVIGCSATGGDEPITRAVQITADMDSEAKAGEELVVVSTVRNLGSDSGSFVVSVEGYEDWATLKSVSKRILNLDAGESEEVTITFELDKEASGENSFEVAVLSNGKTETKAFSVDVAKSSSGVNLGSLFSGSSSLVWVIAIVNIVLIILIIVVAVKLARK